MSGHEVSARMLCGTGSVKPPYYFRRPARIGPDQIISAPVGQGGWSVGCRTASICRAGKGLIEYTREKAFFLGMRMALPPQSLYLLEKPAGRSYGQIVV